MINPTMYEDYLRAGVICDPKGKTSNKCIWNNLAGEKKDYELFSQTDQPNGYVREWAEA